MPDHHLPAVPRLLDWRPLRRNTLMGFASVGFPSGVVMHEIGIHASHGEAWAAPPSRPWLKDNATVLDRDGKVRWQVLVEFVDRHTRDRWSAQIIAALDAEHPEVLAEAGMIPPQPALVEGDR